MDDPQITFEDIIRLKTPKRAYSQIRRKEPNNEEQDHERYIKFAIEIEDSGVGISKENLPNIFIDFMKLQEHQKINPNGTGLGLSICKLIVEKMNGKIDVNSELGVGTTFKVTIFSKIFLEN